MKLEFIHNNYLLYPYLDSKINIQKCPVFNFLSVSSIKAIQLNDLIPLTPVKKLLIESSYGDADTKIFDMAYAKQININQKTNIAFMTLMSVLPQADTTIVLSDFLNPYITPIVDSLTKYIQERYGIISYFIKHPEDIDDLAFSEFSNEGFLNYQSDMENFHINEYKNIDVSSI